MASWYHWMASLNEALSRRYICTYLHTCIPTYSHRYICMDLHVCIPTNSRRYICMYLLHLLCASSKDPTLAKSTNRPWAIVVYFLLKFGPFPASFSLFLSFKYCTISIGIVDAKKICWWLDSNRNSRVSEATALPTESLPSFFYCIEGK